MFGLSIFAALFFATSLWGMEIEKKSLAFSIMTYNVCNFHGMENESKVSHLAWEKRKEKIFTLILDEKPDVIGFQELRNSNGKSVIKDLWNGLGDHGYDIIHCPWNCSVETYFNVIAYKNEKFMVGKSDNWWLSDSPSVCSSLGEKERPRRVLMLSLYFKKDETIDYSCPIYIANVHNSVNHEIKIQSNRILVDEIRKRTQWKDGIVILMGDFNTLINNNPKTNNELSFVKNDGYVELLHSLKTKNGVSISGTFVGYSSDRYQCPQGQFGGQLDHMFLKKLSEEVLYESQSYVNAKRYNGNDNEEAQTENELLAGLDGKENRDEFPSDHIPGIVTLKVFFDKNKKLRMSNEDKCHSCTGDF